MPVRVAVALAVVSGLGGSSGDLVEDCIRRTENHTFNPNNGEIESGYLKCNAGTAGGCGCYRFGHCERILVRHRILNGNFVHDGRFALGVVECPSGTRIQ